MGMSPWSIGILLIFQGADPDSPRVFNPVRKIPRLGLENWDGDDSMGLEYRDGDDSIREDCGILGWARFHRSVEYWDGDDSVGLWNIRMEMVGYWNGDDSIGLWNTKMEMTP